MAIAVKLPFELADATKHLAGRDECLKRLIDETRAFEWETGEPRSPYEALLKSIAYQSISGKAAATIFGRVVALGKGGRPPRRSTVALRKPVLRKQALRREDRGMKTWRGRHSRASCRRSSRRGRCRTRADQRLTSSVKGLVGRDVPDLPSRLAGRAAGHDLGVRKGWCVAYGKKHMPKPKGSAFDVGGHIARSRAGMWRAFERAGYATTIRFDRRRSARSVGRARGVAVNVPDAPAGASTLELRPVAHASPVGRSPTVANVDPRLGEVAHSADSHPRAGYSCARPQGQGRRTRRGRRSNGGGGGGVAGGRHRLHQRAARSAIRGVPPVVLVLARVGRDLRLSQRPRLVADGAWGLAARECGQHVRMLAPAR